MNYGKESLSKKKKKCIFKEKYEKETGRRPCL